ncbi:hypothetical protein L6R52_27745 [Myxococcota bacterium]|nr:hypothetical protein [Myxococcota bacterium]
MRLGGSVSNVGRVLIVLATLAACGDADAPPFAIPRTDTDFVIFGTAQAGRAAVPSAVRIVRATDLTTLRPDSIGGGDVDMFFAGLDRADLPADLDPTMLVVVGKNDDGARALPPLYAAHVLERTGPADAGLELGPVGGELPSSVAEERAERLRKMIEGLAIQDPCLPPSSPISITVPRTSGEEITAFRTLSSGETFVGFTMTSTVMLGVLTPGALDLELVGVSTGSTAIQRGERTRVFDLGDREARTPSGRVVPDAIALSYVGAFGTAAQLLVFDPAAGRWVDDTPFPADPAMASIQPDLVSGVRHVELDGETALCAHGSVRGPNRVAGLWCRTETSTVWTVAAAIRDAYSFIGVVDRDGDDGPLALDITGRVYTHEPRGWRPVVEPAVNDGCAPPCVTFDPVTRAPASSGLLAAVGGSDAQVLLVSARAGGLPSLDALPIVDSVLFSDERIGAEDDGLRFTSLAFSPDGALWLGSRAPVLVRVSPDRTSARRICLPPEAAGATVSAIEAHPSGELYLGMNPAMLGFGTWAE